MRDRVRPVLVAVGLVAVGLLAGAPACSARPEPGAAATREPIVGLPCEGCEAVFEGLPAELDWRTRLAAVGEPVRDIVLGANVPGYPAREAGTFK